MGRKTEKSLIKKYKLKENKAQNALAARYHNVTLANRQDDPMKELAIFKKYERNGLKLTISCEKMFTLDDDTAKFVFDITKENMKGKWDERAANAEKNGFEKFKEDWTWHDKERMDEMHSEHARFLIARDEENRPVGMVYFRFEYRSDDEILFCYEVQVKEEIRRKGLGKHFMQILELLSFKMNMSKIQLTCWHDDIPSVALFRENLKYELDETSPQTLFYEVLCKVNKKKKVIPVQLQFCRIPGCKVANC